MKNSMLSLKRIFIKSLMISLLIFMVFFIATTSNSETANSGGKTEVDHFNITQERINQAVAYLKKCADNNTDAGNMYYCSCEVDIFLSQLPAPEDQKAHCKEVVRQNLQFIKLPKKEQMSALMETGAKDINVNSLYIFSFVAPCLIKALKFDDNEKMERVEKCLCLTHEFANKLFSKKFSSNSDVVDEMVRLTKNIISSNNCNK